MIKLIMITTMTSIAHGNHYKENMTFPWSRRKCQRRKTMRSINLMWTKTLKRTGIMYGFFLVLQCN